jgi:signal transduction histidine kinase
VGLLQPAGDGSTVTVRAAVGEDAERLVGRPFVVAGTLTGSALDGGEPLLVDVSERKPVEGSFLACFDLLGPVMLVPLVGSHGVRGVLITGRRVDRWPFSPGELEMASTFATHASLALELADARLDQERMTLLEDRTRIAADLHDHVIQQLFAAGMTLKGVAAGMADDRRAELLDKVVDTLDDAVKRIRTSIFQLRPQRHHGSSLRASVLEVVADLTPALGFEAHVGFDGPVDAVSDAGLSEDVLAVVRELLTNAAKHANATSATVTIHATASRFDVTVADDGRGLSGDRRSGLGNLRARAERRGGSLRLNDPPPEQGTRVVWTVPFG